MLDPKIPFSITPTLRCREGGTHFPALFNFSLDTYLILNVKEGSINYHFSVFCMTGPGIEPLSPMSLANTVHKANGQVRYIYIYIYIYIYTNGYKWIT